MYIHTSNTLRVCVYIYIYICIFILYLYTHISVYFIASSYQFVTALYHVNILVCTHMCVYIIYIYIYIYTHCIILIITANLRTKILDFRGFDSSVILFLRCGILMSIGDPPESLSQAILVGIMLVGRLGAAR